MNTEIQNAQVNALKIADMCCNELVDRKDIQLFFAQILGERKASVQINRYEYLLDNIYPIVYQHLLVDAPLSEDALVESAKIVSTQMNGAVARASEAVAKELVSTEQWQALYDTIQPMQGLKKTPWDLQNLKIVDDAVHFVARLVHVNCSSPISPDNATKWVDHFAQKSFGLTFNTTTDSNHVYSKSKTFATKVMKNGFMDQSHALYARQLFAQIAQQLQTSRNLIARHCAWPNVVVASDSASTKDVCETQGQDDHPFFKMNHR